MLDYGTAAAAAGETFPVAATVLREGHGALGAAAVLFDGRGRRRAVTRMAEEAPGTDRYTAELAVPEDAAGRWSFAVEAWADPFATWLHAARAKIPAGQDTELMCEEGARILDQAARRVPRRPALAAAAARLRDTSLTGLERLAAAQAGPVAEAMAAEPVRTLATRSKRFPLTVHRRRALVGSWYEFFPRSAGAEFDAETGQWRSGTLRSAAKRLPAIADMGFDVVYLPPVHPVGHTFRKGRGNTLQAGPGDPGSVWAIGAREGGHDAVHPDLGDIRDFDAFTSEAAAHGLEVALDLALQCSPDHPWVAEHPEWFTERADGSIAHAENPPKKYQDIYPLDFDRDPEGLYAEVLRIVRYWMDHGVRIFRVDNPHTKPLWFWERLLGEIAASDPDVLFLAEAFTRPATMRALARAGFHQSYTYFTWRTGKEELTGYLTELSTEAAPYMRPNLFANTPDILHAYLQQGGRPAFEVRAVLAGTLAPTWGVYSGFELCENTPAGPGSEEYFDSEKYTYRPRDYDAAEASGLSIAPLLRRINGIRRDHPALQELRNLRFHHADRPEIICYSKRLAGGGPAGADDVVIAVVNLDPHRVREATVHLDLPSLGLPAGAPFTVRDELTGAAYPWGAANYVRLDPAVQPAHVFTVSG